MICKFEELYQQEAQGQRARYQALREGFKAQAATRAASTSAPLAARRLAATTPTTSMAACWPLR